MQQGRSRGKGHGCGQGQGSRRQRSVHNIDDGDEYEYDSEGGTDVHFDALTIVVDAVGIKECAYATLNVRLPGSADSKTFRLKVDIGAEGNILPLCINCRMFPRNLDADGFLLVAEWPAKLLWNCALTMDGKSDSMGLCPSLAASNCLASMTCSFLLQNLRVLQSWDSQAANSWTLCASSATTSVLMPPLWIVLNRWHYPTSQTSRECSRTGLMWLWVILKGHTGWSLTLQWRHGCTLIANMQSIASSPSSRSFPRWKAWVWSPISLSQQAGSPV